MQQSVKLLGLDSQYGFLFVYSALFHHIYGYFERGDGGTLAVARLEHIKLASFDCELHVLHIPVMVFEDFADADKLFVNRLVLLFELSYGLRSTDTRHDVLALRVHQILAEQLLFARCGIARKGNTRSRVLAHVAENHRLHVDRRSPIGGNVVHPSVINCSRVVPAAEHRKNRLYELLLGVLGKFLSFEFFVGLLKFDYEFFEVVCVKLGVKRHALGVLCLFQKLFVIVLGNFHNDVGKHLYKTSVTVVSKTGIARKRCQPLYRFVVESEIEYSVHHARHGRSRAAAHRHEQGIFDVAQLFAQLLFRLFKRLENLLSDFLGKRFSVLVILVARLRRDGKAVGYGKTEIHHLGKVGSFAAQKLAHFAVSFVEQVNVLCHISSSI